MKNEIKDLLCTFVTFKQRGETLEVSTIFSTLYGDLVSVFVKKLQDGNYLVSDGGWLNRGEYRIVPSDKKIVEILLENHDVVKEKDPETGEIFFNKRVHEKAVPLAVIDIAEFIVNIINYHLIKEETNENT